MQIVIEDLSVERGGRAVLEGLSFSVSSGEALVLLGANGAGKTTLLRTLAGLLSPSHGSIRLVGGDGDKSIGEQAHTLGHANAIKGRLTVAENIAFWATFLATPKDASDLVAKALTQFGLGALADYPAGYLSAGQKRRLGLARLLAADRPIWLLDEPTASLDDASAALLADAVNAHTRNGGIAIAATHLSLGFSGARELRLDAARSAA